MSVGGVLVHAQNEYKAEKPQQNVAEAAVGFNFLRNCNGTALKEAMFGKGFQGLAQQTQGSVQDAANALGEATQRAVNQATAEGQKVVDQACKMAQEGIDKTTGQAANSVSDLEKKLGLKK